MAREVDEWVRKVGIGKVEWSRKWARSIGKRSVRPGDQYEWVIDLKLTAKIGGQFVIYTRMTMDELLEMGPGFSKDQLQEIVVAYVEFKLSPSEEALPFDLKLNVKWA